MHRLAPQVHPPSGMLERPGGIEPDRHSVQIPQPPLDGVTVDIARPCTACIELAHRVAQNISGVVGGGLEVCPQPYRDLGPCGDELSDFVGDFQKSRPRGP